MSAETESLEREIERTAAELRERSCELETRVRDGLTRLAELHPMLLLGGSIAAGLIVGRALTSPVVAEWLRNVDRDSLPR